MIQGTSSGAGKSTLVTALCRIFSDRGFTVAPFKSQNMSCYSYVGRNFEISRAQAIQAVGARTEPIPEMNPILLKPRGDQTSTVYLNGRRHKRMRALHYHHTFARSRGLPLAMGALKKLLRDYEVVIIEGAGSPAEINLQRYDIANMAIAQGVRAPVILVADIDRGGAFASLAGTLSLLGVRHRGLVRGMIFNKFRGDPAILAPGMSKLRRLTGKDVLGVVPMIKLDIPDEDSLYVRRGKFAWNKRNVAKLDAEIDRLAKTVTKSINIKKIEAMMR